ncbi:MAG: cupredoxin domain-containing protein, partial [Chloroflexi bacterium]|nr:cupredoxin domain-containing protein [Chloroflexota bacterium]
PTSTPLPPTSTPLPPTSTPLPPTSTPLPPTATPLPTATPTPVVIEVPTEVTIEFRDDAINPEEFIILENTDTEFTLANLTLDDKTFFIDGLDITQEGPAGETVAITVNAPIGEYGYGIVDEDELRGTLRVIERAVTPTAAPTTPVPTSAPIPPPPGE